MSTYQHYDQEYDFPEADPLFGPQSRTMDWIPAGNPKQWLRRRGRRSGLLVRLRRRAHRPLLQNILLANVQSLDNKLDEIKARVDLPERHHRLQHSLLYGNMAHSGYVRVGTTTWFLHASRRQKQTSL